MFVPWIKLGYGYAPPGHGVPVRDLDPTDPDRSQAGELPTEAMLMVTEKVSAFGEAAVTIAMGGSAHKVVRGYRRHVKANVRRLKVAQGLRPNLGFCHSEQERFRSRTVGENLFGGVNATAGVTRSAAAGRNTSRVKSSIPASRIRDPMAAAGSAPAWPRWRPHRRRQHHRAQRPHAGLNGRKRLASVWG